MAEQEQSPDRERKRRHRVLLPAAGALMAAAALTGAALCPAAASAAPASQAAVHDVSYHGYHVQVPASWPVYNLATDPSRCVLFSKHAVYLGTPGASQQCPARAYGHADSILIQPATTATTGPAVTAGAQRAAASDPQDSATMAADPAEHVIQVNAPGPGVVVTAAYGQSQTTIRSILAAATTTAQPSAAPSPASPAPAAPAPAAAPAAAPPVSGTADLTGMTGSGLGFDACTAPSAATMTSWLASPYRVIGTYLGGVNWACTYGNFSASWVSQVASEGWRFIPIWVGRQAPCSGIGAVIDPSQAAAQGQAEAADAVATAQSFGYDSGTPIYFDMEGYSGPASCSQAVLTFLNAWTQGLHAAGYLSGVYSSAGSGIVDLASEDNGTTTVPDAIWLADWTGDPVLSDSFVPDSDWADSQRLHQYYGGHNETWGGDTVDVDDNVIGGPVAGLPGAHTDSGPSLLAGPAAVTIAPGSAASVQLTVQGTPTTPAAEQFAATAPSGLTVTPASGRIVVPPGKARTLTVTISASAAAAAGRYDLPLSISVGSKTVAEMTELVSVAPPGATLSTAHPIVLYAADGASMAAAQAQAQALDLPAADVTGSFSQAWNDLTASSDLVLAVGQAATNGLYFNPCGWANPAGEGAGSTPFAVSSRPVQQSPGADTFELAGGTTDALTAVISGQLSHYALDGTLPGYGRPASGPAQPTRTCLGSPDVPVP